MKFVLNMAWREMRASWHRLLLFFLCIAIGVGSIIGLRSLVQSISAAISRESRLLIAADVAVEADGPWKAESMAVLERFFHSPLVSDHTETLELGTMVRSAADPNATPRLVWLTAVQQQYPLYGEVRLVDGQRYHHSLLKDRGVLVRPKLLVQHNLKVGDQIKIGRLSFTIRGVIQKEPGQMLHFRPAPRVLVDYNDVLAAGLTDFGSRVRRNILFKTREGQDETLIRQLRRELRTDRSVSMQSYRYREGMLSEQSAQVENFLSLLGLVILALGGIGISSVTRVFIQQKMKTIAILKCLGGDNRQILGTYLAQVVALGLTGSLLGLALAQAVTIGLPKYLADRISFDVEYGVTQQAALQGLGAGLLVALLFSLPPLLEIRQVKPILVLRKDTVASGRRVDWLRLGAGLLILLGLLALAAWQAGSFKIGRLFLGGLVATSCILNLTGVALIRSLRTVRHLPSFALRQGVNSLYRPGNQTRVILFAVGLGAFFVITVRLLQVNLVGEFNFSHTLAMHDLGMIDIQKDQRPELEAAVSRLAGDVMRIIPLLRVRIVGHGPPNREWWVSYRPKLEPYEKVVAGSFWEPSPSPVPEISISERFSQNFQLGVGDSITFNILGKQMTARIASIHGLNRYAWTPSSEIIFRPGTLEDAPQTFAAQIKGRSRQGREHRLCVKWRIGSRT